MKTGSIVDYVERELDWVQGQLGVPTLGHGGEKQ